MMTIAFAVLFFGGICVLGCVTMIVGGLIRAVRTGKAKEWDGVSGMVAPTLFLIGAIYLTFHLAGAF